MEPATATLESGSLFEDRYEILEELGSGSFGCVYRARQHSTGQWVAVKLLTAREGAESSSERERERFQRETEICSALSHPNIVRLIDSGETKSGQLYTVFEYVPGETLAAALGREGTLEVRECVRLMTQVLEALGSAHAKGIVHRDIKPANLMLSAAGVRRSALVLDFGLGGLAEGRHRKQWETLTQSREFLGTPLYAAPEQLAGETPTERSDLYAWGLVFLESLTGERPFEREGATGRLLSGGGSVEIPAWLHDHPLGELLQTVTTREAEKRDVPVEKLIEALDAMLGGELPVAPARSSTPRPLRNTGERRHLTVMFCDLIGSSELSQKLDAETYRQLLKAYHARGAEAVERYGGYVVQYLGDGLLAYFGYPQAHEDDAERAVRAARELLRNLEMLSTQSEAEHGVSLAARVGIHSGPVVVDEVGSGEKKEVLALGETPIVAARLEGFAEPGTVVMSDATLRLVAGVFVTKDRTVPALNGIEKPIRVHQVFQPSGVPSRLDRAPSLTPFVGRDQELGLLLDRFELVQEGQGQAVLVAGEAGIGKSRLVRELRERLRGMPYSWLECRTSPYTQGSALYPLVEMLEEALDFQEEGAAEKKLEKLERGLAHVGLEPDEAVPLFASLLSLRLPERYTPLEISPQLQRQKTLEALLVWVLALGEKQTLVLVVEDLHWIDPSTLEWLGLVIEQCPTTGLLLLLTHRPEFEPPWPARGHVLPIALSRLRRSEARSLFAGAIAATTLPDEIIDQIAMRADGIPLFVEELAKDIVESGRDLAGSLSSLAIPETLQDSLMARLDRLGEAKQVAQLGAALGREFPYGLLEAVAPMKETELRERLGRLVEAELLYQRGLPPSALYTFKHALVQDTAYQSLLENQRQEFHGRIADALEKQFPESVAREPEEIARHCEEAGRTTEAIGHYRRAAERAMQHSARAEAIDHLHQAMALLGTLPETSERKQHELQLQLALGAALIGAKGYGDPEVERVHARAHELCQGIGESPELARALVMLSLFHYMRGRLAIAAELAEQALTLAEQEGELYLLLVAHTRLGINLYHQAEWTRADEHLELAVALYDPAEHRPLAAVWGQDWGVAARNQLTWTLWCLGYPERALRLSRETVELAREDSFSLAFALTWAGQLAHWRGDRERALACADEAIAISRERGYPVWLMFAIGVRSVTLCDARELEQSPAWDGAGSLSHHMSIAQVYLKLGRTADAAAALDAGFARTSENRAQDVSMQRTRGEIRLQQGAVDEAESSFRRALEVAREQKAKSLELRAATSLARLLRDRGRRDEARALLQPVYAWFTEGFDTADLKDAKALLDEL